MTEQAQPIPGQDPAATPPAAAPAPVATAPPAQPPAAALPASQGPWSADLEAAFADESVRSQVDGFLREKVQPHVTRIEQSAKPATDLYGAFEREPDQAFAEIAGELYGPEAAKAIADYVETLDEGDPFTDPTYPEAQPTAQTAAQLDPRVQALIDADQAKQDEAAFNSEFARVKQENPGVELVRDLFVPLVAKHGDFDQAVTEYQTQFKDYLAFRAQEAATATAAGAVPPEGTAPAPPTLGTGTAAGGTPPPTVPQENPSLHGAIDDFFAEQAATAPGESVAPPSPASA